MKKVLLFIICLIIPMVASARDVKISVTPSTARIYIDGNYVGDGVVCKWDEGLGKTIFAYGFKWRRICCGR